MKKQYIIPIVIFVAYIFILIFLSVMLKYSKLSHLLIQKPVELARVRCYDEPSTRDSFPELNASREQLLFGPRRNIFFLETSCFQENGYAQLNCRQACSVEAAARMNPGMLVNLFYLSPAPPSDPTKRLVQLLLKYDNVHQVCRLKVAEYIHETPIERWYLGGVLAQSLWPNIHMCDFLRILTLWKYGGIYLDLDVVVTTHRNNRSFEELPSIKSIFAVAHSLTTRNRNLYTARSIIQIFLPKPLTFLENFFEKLLSNSTHNPQHLLPWISLRKPKITYRKLNDLRFNIYFNRPLDDLTNFVGFQSSWRANSAVLGLTARGFGFKVATECLRQLMESYRGDDWDDSSCGLLSRVAQKLCATEVLEEMTLDRCHGLQVFPPSAFYPVDWWRDQWKRFFRTNDSTETMQLINAARAVHFWNSLTKNTTVLEGSPYAQVAEKFCPIIYHHCGRESL